MRPFLDEKRAQLQRQKMVRKTDLVGVRDARLFSPDQNERAVRQSEFR